MKICPYCGMGLDDTDVVCPACGKAVGASEPDPIPPTAPASSMDPIPSTAPAGYADQIPPTAPAGYADVIPPTAPAGYTDPIPPTAPAGYDNGPSVFCPNCGERLEPGSVFCPNCGFALSQPAPAPKAAKSKAPKAPKAPKQSGGGKNKTLGIAAVAVAAVVVVVLLAVFVLPSLFMSDADRFLSYQANLVVDPAMALGLDTLTGGKLSTDLTISAKTDDDDINQILDDTSVVLKVDLDGTNILLDATLNLMGTELFNGAVAKDDKTVAFYLPQADDTWYSMDLAELLYMATGTELDEVKMPDISAKQVTKIVDRYLGLLADVVTKDNLEVEKDERVQYLALDGKFNGTLYTFEPRHRDIQDMLDNIADELEGDKDLLEILTQIASYSDVKNPEKEARNALKDLAENIHDNAKDLGEMIEDAGFVWTLAVEGKTVRQILITANGETLGYEAKGDADDMDHVLFYGYEDEIEEDDIVLEANTSVDGKKREGTVTVPSYSESYEFSYEIDDLSKTSPLGIPYGSYELLYSYYDYWDEGTNTMTIALDVEDDGDGGADHVITVNGAELFDDEFSKLEVTLNATEKGTAKKAKADTEDITDYSDRELQELFEDLGADLVEGIQDEIGDDLMDVLGIGGGSAEPDYGW